MFGSCQAFAEKLLLAAHLTVSRVCPSQEGVGTGTRRRREAGDDISKQGVSQYTIRSARSRAFALAGA